MYRTAIGRDIKLARGNRPYSTEHSHNASVLGTACTSAYSAKLLSPGTAGTSTGTFSPESRHLARKFSIGVPAVPVAYLRYQYPDSVLKVPDPAKEARWVGAADALGGGGAGGGPRHLSSNLGWFRGCLDAKGGLCRTVHTGNAANATYTFFYKGTFFYKVYIFGIPYISIFWRTTSRFLCFSNITL